MKTGRSAGMFTIGVAWGFRPKAELVELGAQMIIENLQDLLKIFEAEH